MDRGAWWATVHEVANSQTILSDKAEVLIIRLKTVMLWLSCLLTKQMSTRFSRIMFKTKLAIPRKTEMKLTCNLKHWIGQSC